MAAKLAAVITLLALLGPVACEYSKSNSSPSPRRSILCLGGWIRPIQILKLFTICPGGSDSNPPPAPSPPPSAPWLKVGYYNYSCPNAEYIVRDLVEKAGPGTGAGLIRLFFHDCFVQGCDASVLLDAMPGSVEQTEKFGAPNINSLRQSAFDLIDAAKDALKRACPKTQVSCADIIAFAARDASYFLGSKYNKMEYFPMPAGRYDGKVSLKRQAEQELPGPFSNLQQLTLSFAAKGLDESDLVTLSGAHSIGNARCLFFTDRLSEMEPKFADGLNKNCTRGGGNTRVNQDYKTPDVLDNQYYKNILDKKVLFTSDDTLSSTAHVGKFAKDDGSWEKAFAQAMKKMGDIGVKTSANGEIRNICSRVN
ncbi:hypothetical protein ACP70R_005294 [Stipagrostis hirtigluma subsp. patula]